MPVLQESFYIPDEIYEGLLSGELKRFGGVVRAAEGANRGEIVKHLEPVGTTIVKGAAKAAQSAIQKSSKGKNNNAAEKAKQLSKTKAARKVKEAVGNGNAVKAVKSGLRSVAKAITANKNTAAAVGVAAAVVGVGAGVYKYATREPEEVREFREALGRYLDAVRAGELDIDIIDSLTVALDRMKQLKNYKKYEIKLSPRDLDTLVNKINEYTRNLAEKNNVELTDSEVAGSGDAMFDLRQYLKAQKRIFEEAA